jgi:hypothetical protein
MLNKNKKASWDKHQIIIAQKKINYKANKTLTLKHKRMHSMVVLG